MASDHRLLAKWIRLGCILAILVSVALPRRGATLTVAACPEWCPDIGYISCAAEGWCEDREGEACRAPTVPEGCESCSWVYECKDWNCTGQLENLKVYRCVQGDGGAH